MDVACLNHKAKKSNTCNPQNNSGLCQYVTSVRKTSAVHIKIMISITDNFYDRHHRTNSKSLITAMIKNISTDEHYVGLSAQCIANVTESTVFRFVPQRVY